VNSPETKLEKQAFEIVESARVAKTKLECFVANKKPDVSEQTFQALKNAIEIREIEYDSEVLWLLGEMVLSTEDILAAEVVDQPGGNFGLLVQVTEAAGERLRIATTNNLNKLLAIVVDGQVVSAPKIVDPIGGTRFTVSGDFTRESATELAEQIVPELKLPAGIKVSSGVSRRESMENLRRLALVIHNYADAYNRFPNQKNTNVGTDNPPYSWRVAILPYMDGQQSLYDQYRFDQPWDSEENLLLLEKMPEVFRHPSAPKNSIVTNYTLFVGEDTAISNAGNRRFADFLDGASNSLLLLEADTEIPWTKPEDLPMDEDWFKRLVLIDDGGLAIAMADGSTMFLDRENVNQETLESLILINDGKVVDRATLQSPAASEPSVPTTIIGN
jgi:hypothetical protein